MLVFQLILFSVYNGQFFWFLTNGNLTYDMFLFFGGTFKTQNLKKLENHTSLKAMEDISNWGKIGQPIPVR